MLSSKTLFFALVYVTATSLAAPVRREVPQERAHQPISDSVKKSLDLNNPDGFVDPVFGLLGNAAAQQGIGTNLKDPDCLQQAIADQAFTNAKAAGDVQGQVDALIYRALERNSGSVGATSNKCTSVQAVNPEIAAIQQHQDPASDNAAAVNKAIVLELAKQIASVGGNPLDAIKSGTFTPGQIGDPTAKGNSCDDDGCIFTENLLVPDASEAEINAAVAGVSSSNNSVNSPADSAASCAATVTVTVAASQASATAVASSSNPGQPPNPASGQNLQTFTGALGGATAPAVSPGGRGFVVDGSDDFLNVGAALGRSCDIQHNACANLANSGGGFSVSNCDQQNNQCRAAINA